MRLTKQLKADLLEAVMKDQFMADIDANNKKIRETARTTVKQKYAQFDADLKTLAAKHDVDVNLLGSTPNDMIDIDSEYVPLTIEAFSTQRYTNTKQIAEINNTFEAGVHIPKKKRFYNTRFKPATLGVTKIIDKQTKLFEKAREVHNDLVAVLNSVTTVKKLQEITKVFDPFLPTEYESNSLVPTEPLCRINKLKSPKNKKA